MKSGLYIVATPIGNLEDITLRAINVLKKSDVILCENTKHSLKLLRHFDIKNVKIEKYTDHDFNKKHKYIEGLIKSEKIISLISDAGSPIISDPGSNLVKYLFGNDCHIESIPGPSSIVSAMQLSGFYNSYPTTFFGFLPKKIEQKKKCFKNMTSSNIVFFTTSPQLNKDIETIFDLDPSCKITVLNEMTKKFEKRLSFSSKEYEQIKPLVLKGEFVICVEYNGVKEILELNDNQILKDLAKYGSKNIYEIYRTTYNIKRNELYKKILTVKKN